MDSTDELGPMIDSCRGDESDGFRNAFPVFTQLASLLLRTLGDHAEREFSFATGQAQRERAGLPTMPPSGPSTPAATITTLDEKLTDADSAAPAQFLHDHGLTSDTLPYWLVNMPRSQWSTECPSFLRDQPPKNIRCLATPDEKYQRQDWDLVQEIIR